MSSIEWTGDTWNPVSGCTRVSAGCDHCYAVPMTRRLAAMGQEPYQGLVNPGKGHFNGTVRLNESQLLKPLRRKKPMTYFLASMSDVFHEGVPDEYLDRIFAVMALCPQHTFQVLTKRPERMAEYFEPVQSHWRRRVDREVRVMVQLDFWLEEDEVARRKDMPVRYAQAVEHLATVGLPLPNVWLGTSVEDQATADDRIPHLLRCPAAIRFLSMEPLLGWVDLNVFGTEYGFGTIRDHRGSYSFYQALGFEAGSKVLRPGIDWVIVGGESGHGARRMHPDWVRSIRDQCADSEVPFFFKQWGRWMPYEPQAGGDLGGLIRKGKVDEVYIDGGDPAPRHIPGRRPRYVIRVGKKEAGRLLDGIEHNGIPAHAGTVTMEAA